jgi:hypothetical protein
MKETEIVIGIPGKWADRRELSRALLLSNVKNGGYIMLGDLIANAQKNSSFEIELYGHDDDLKQAFYNAGNYRLEPALLDEIDEHTATLYIIARTTGVEVAKELIEVVSDVLKAGGLAVKIETTGIAHSKESWLELQGKIDDLAQVHYHFLTLTDYNEFYSSFGMKTFGYPDVIVPITLSQEDALALMQSFTFYTVTNQPVLISGETYSMGIDATFYKMTIREDDRYEDGDNYNNPFGVVVLEPLGEKEEKKKRNIVKKWFGK